eukprot:TRINITY_DN14127_c0_g1_i1.p2 TRINITY_DN14127_c0_g1~~TRINITY_DN14127_c0_g1_i1.p2  ORF type:complete len:121 (+),score=21.99 TRINITY_DN14127_c0_g1_i1:40-402(+)
MSCPLEHALSGQQAFREALVVARQMLQLLPKLSGLEPALAQSAMIQAEQLRAAWNQQIKTLSACIAQIESLQQGKCTLDTSTTLSAQRNALATELLEKNGELKGLIDKLRNVQLLLNTLQ